jgi:DNA invertase Pin-like site-specific DNA recombinase
MRVVLYRRVSTNDQGLGLAAQRERLEQEAERRGWGSWEEVTDEGVSGKTPAQDREHLGPALSLLRHGDVLVVAKLDRLSRSVLDFSRMLALSEEAGWSLVCLDPGIDTTTPNGKLIANVLMSVAEWERETISLRIREGLAQSTKRKGRRSGLPAVGGGRREAVPEAVVAVVNDLREQGKSAALIADRLNSYGFQSLRGKRWHRTSVRRLLARLDAAA